MTRNQKIALGCGGAGCLGLIFVGIAAGVVFYFFSQASTPRRNANINFNRNSNFNINANENANTNSNDDDSTNSNSSSSASADSLSEDDKHKLYQAAAVTGDLQLQRRVWVKIGIMDEDFTQGDKFREFIAEHLGWVTRNYQFVLSMDSAEKGRAYINEHLPQ